MEGGSDSTDYSTRKYLSAGEAANFLGTSVRELHRLVRACKVPVTIAASGQQRFDIAHLRVLGNRPAPRRSVPVRSVVEVKGTRQEILCKNSQRMEELEDGSVHLVVTSPPYFNTKMYSPQPLRGDLGDIHSVDAWFNEIGKVWAEVFRVLQPGRKAFINIMNLPIRQADGSFRTLNLVGRTVDVCEDMGFVFKRDIVWHKTNGVRAPFGTYPYPGGILLNNMHEFILELEKPCPRALRSKKYSHVPAELKQESRLDKEFWLSIKNSDVWLMAPQASGDHRDHVAPFPAELPVRLIRAFSYKGEKVLDPFLGSGTSLLAAAGLGRDGVGYEINPEIARCAVEALSREGAELKDR